MSRIYVASSWRNEYQQGIVNILRRDGHAVFDFQNPEHGLGGFQWSEIDPDWQLWNPREFRDNLVSSPVAARGYTTDLRAMMWADTCVLVMPCGRSAHLELGWCAGAGKRTVILLEKGEPELMYLLADNIVCSIEELREVLRDNPSQNRAGRQS